MSTSPFLSRFPTAALVLLAALATGAWGAGSGSDATGDVSESASSAAASSAEPSPTVSAAPTAADGTDYAACDDGSCEVAVSGNPVVFDFGDFTLTVTAIEGGVETEAVSGGASSGGTMTGGYCIAYQTAGGGSSGGTLSCYALADGEVPPVPEPAPGELAVELLDFTEGTAIIRLTMG
jgi:hypothetical protein